MQSFKQKSEISFDFLFLLLFLWIIYPSAAASLHCNQPLTTEEVLRRPPAHHPAAAASPLTMVPLKIYTNHCLFPNQRNLFQFYHLKFIHKKHFISKSSYLISNEGPVKSHQAAAKVSKVEKVGKVGGGEDEVGGAADLFVKTLTRRGAVCCLLHGTNLIRRTTEMISASAVRLLPHENSRL